MGQIFKKLKVNIFCLAKDEILNKYLEMMIVDTQQGKTSP